MSASVYLFVLFVFVFLGACKPVAERLYTEAHTEIEKGHFRIAVDLLEKSAELEQKETVKIKSLLEAASIARFEIQDYARAVRIYRAIILKSLDEEQRIGAQRAIAEIYFEDLQSYDQALKELQILQPLVRDDKEKEKIKLKIAQTLYLTGNYQQALEEISTVLNSIKNEMLNFLKLKAQVLTAQKKYKEAIAVYEEIRKKDTKYFEQENLFIATSVVYEENEEYAEALEYLTKFEEKIKDKAYYELRFKRLKERLVNRPFYKGRRK